MSAYIDSSEICDVMFAPIGLQLPAHGEDGGVAEHLVIVHLVADTGLGMAPAGAPHHRL